MKSNSVYLLTFLATLSGCDPAKIITTKNLTNDKVETIWIYRDAFLTGSENSFLMRDTVLMTLNENERRKKMYFGIGGWSDNALNELLTNIESLEVRGVEMKTKLRGKEEVKQFLMKRRKGLFKNRIIVEIR